MFHFVLIIIIKVVFEAFHDADSPMPFSFGFSGGPVEIELIENEKTNEDLFINCVDSDQDGMAVLIERSAMEKKSSETE